MTGANDKLREAIRRAPKRSKFGNRKVRYRGVLFDSEKEFRRWLDLCVLEKSGLIRNLRRQVKYPLYARDTQVCVYIADHDFWEGEEHVTEDVKGVLTDVFKLKAKMFAACYGRQIRIVY